MAELLATSYCRICLEAKSSNCSLYQHVRQKYLPSVIDNICGVLISSFDEPDALVCRECAVALVQADEIIQKCRASHKLLGGQRAPVAEDQPKHETEADAVMAMTIGKQKQAQLEKEVYPAGEQLLKPQTEDESLEMKEESESHDVPDLDGIGENLFVEPEMFVESILESSRDTASTPTTPTPACTPKSTPSGGSRNTSTAPPKFNSTPPISTTQSIQSTAIYQSTLKRTKPKKKLVRSREQYLKRKIRNYPVKEPLTLIGGAGVVRKRKPKTFHRAIPNFYFRCELCHAFESNVASYAVTHLSATHGIERPAIFRCSQCDTKPFIKNQSLQEHIATIHRQQPKARDFVCACCGKTFIKNCHLQKHLLSVHKQPMQVECELKMPCEHAAAATLTLSCPQCGYKFRQRTRYEAHVKRARCQPPSSEAQEETALGMSAATVCI